MYFDYSGNNPLIIATYFLAMWATAIMSSTDFYTDSMFLSDDIARGDWGSAALDGGAGVDNGVRKAIKAGDITEAGYKFTNHAAENAIKRGFTGAKIDNIILKPSQKVYQSGGITVFEREMVIFTM